MDALPDRKTDPKFQAMLAQLLVAPAFSAKQQLELEMSREITRAMLRLVESMRQNGPDMDACLRLVKYAKVVDFILALLAERREISPQTLRVIFKVAGLRVDEAYPC